VGRAVGEPPGGAHGESRRSDGRAETGEAASKGGEAARDLFRRLLRHNEGLRDFRARFRQSLISRGLDPLPPETGSVLYRRPFKMRWEYEQPERKIAVSDGQTGWLYLPDEKRVLRVDLQKTVGEGPLPALLSGAEEALRQFSVELLPARQGSVGLLLVPVVLREDFSSVELLARAGSLEITEVQVVDPGGNRMVYQFSDMETNLGLPEKLFEFVPPEGVEVSTP
jgi:outer membrane lipoprotein carrier protein